MKAELGLAAFERLVERGLLRMPIQQGEIERALLEPFVISGKKRRYRYPYQKSRYITKAFVRVASEKAPASPKALREWLLSFEGVGLKTASWITRNFLNSDSVAIIDIHVFRAGVLMGLFDAKESIAKDYLGMEERMLEFAQRLDVGLAFLDALIWDEMRQLSRLALRCLAQNTV